MFDMRPLLDRRTDGFSQGERMKTALARALVHDPATPPRHGARVAQALGPAAQHVIVAYAGHCVLGVGCARDVLFRFIDAPQDRDASAVDAGCLKAIPRPGVFHPIDLDAGRAKP
jgi:hypothetical protein